MLTDKQIRNGVGPMPEGHNTAVPSEDLTAVIAGEKGSAESAAATQYREEA